jgi:hypothetical protein
MARSVQFAAALSEQDTQLFDVLRLSLVEGLSLCAIAWRLQLSLGLGTQSVFYCVEVAERGRRRRHDTRIQGVGDFAELRQLGLVSDDTW